MPAVLKPIFVGAFSLVSSFMLAAPASQSGPVSEAEWLAMLARAKNGGVIDLGQRPVAFARHTFQPTRMVTIKGGVFGVVYLDDWHNVIFDGSTFEGAPGTPTDLPVFVADSPRALTVRNCRFTGYQTENGELHVRGPSIREGVGVVVEHNLIERMAGFANFVRTTGGRFSDNNVKTVREGLEVVGGSDLTIERNRFEDFRPFDGDHPDAMQFFTTGLTRPGDTASRNVTIRDNLVLGNGKAQGVFVTDQIGMAAKGIGYRDFTIEDNVVVSAAWHGITASEVENVTVRNNRLYKLRNDPYDSRIGIDRSTGAVTGNDADDFIFIGGPKQQSGNRKHGPMDQGKIDTVVADWMARFRKSGA